MTFQKITIIGSCGLTNPVLEQVSLLSMEPISIYNDFLVTGAEIINRIGDSDCVLVSWHTKVNTEVIKASRNLKYIGMCFSLYNEKSANNDYRDSGGVKYECSGLRRELSRSVKRSGTWD